MVLSDAVSDVLVVVLGLAVLGLLVLVLAQGRALRELRRRHAAAFAGVDADSVLAVVAQQADEVDALREQLVHLQRDRLVATGPASAAPVDPGTLRRRSA